jgi:hypothetical protein
MNPCLYCLLFGLPIGAFWAGEGASFHISLSIALATVLICRTIKAREA